MLKQRNLAIVDEKPSRDQTDELKNPFGGIAVPFWIIKVGLNGSGLQSSKFHVPPRETTMKISTFRSCLSALLLATILLPGTGRTETTAAEAPKPVAETPEQYNQRMAWWRDARFGMFIHWGPVSLKGTEIGWSRDAMGTAVYDNLYKDFNPVKFNADEWVAVAKAAGMKYIVLTTRHHDGFCLWDSKYSDYNIMKSPFGRDVVKELSEACRKQGIVYCSYYSICDWWHPLYPFGNETGIQGKPHADMDKFNQYLKNQLAEQIRAYGPLGLVWFDGEWENPWTEARGIDMYNTLRQLQPSIIVNNRVGKSRKGMEGVSGTGFAGDYDTPEQRIGGFNMDRPWETCMTICHQWAWKPNDRMKSLQECVQALLYTVGGDGNLLFNVGPQPNGQIEARQVERLKEMGAFVKKYASGIYGTRGGPFKPGKWGAATRHGDTITLFIMKWPQNGPLQLPLPGRKLVAAKTLSGGTVRVIETVTGLAISLEEKDRDPIATVIELTLDGSTLDLPAVEVDDSLFNGSAAGKPAKASNVYKQQTREYGPQKAFDGDIGSRWATDEGTKQATLEVDLGTPQSIARAIIDEGNWNRVRKFEIQVKEEDAWKVVASGNTLGADKEISFPVPVTGQFFRLSILDATDGPTIHEFQLFNQ